MKTRVCSLCIILTWWGAAAESAGAADKYALLVGVTKYQHARMNDTPLLYPEDDARAVGDLLKESGYTVDLLLGNRATNKAIGDALGKVALKGTQDGVVIVGLFGHGVQYDEDAYFCGFDTSVRFVTDSMGNRLRDKNGQPKLEPDPESMTSMREVLDALTTCGAGGKLLLADCCREDPSAARGRAFGSKLKVSELPAGTVALFACNASERAYEHSDWKHGAFTKALLDACRASGRNVTAAGLFASVQQSVRELVADKVGANGQQNVHGLLNGNVNLQLVGIVRPTTAKPKSLQPPFTKEAASRAQEQWATFLDQPLSISNSLNMRLILVPPGTFTMGSSESSRASNEAPHAVQITKPFYVGQFEVTVGDFRKFVDATGYQTTLERNDSGQNRGWDQSQRRFLSKRGFSWRNPGWPQQDDHPVVNITWEDAKAFVQWLGNQEEKPYRLLTEAEWEYCCRAGTTTPYSVGETSSRLVEVGNVLDDTALAVFRQDSAFAQDNVSDAIKGRDGVVFTARVGSFLPNHFGLYDFHGNVCEWCADWYADDYGDSKSKDPKGALFGENRSARGGRFDTGEYLAKSFTRNHGHPLMSDMILGFRIAQEIP
ncbi:MAG: SUMF1/EgtB/PvdO family nonheme iron enzyme [Planctomycetaceae bacterium]